MKAGAYRLDVEVVVVVVVKRFAVHRIFPRGTLQIYLACSSSSSSSSFLFVNCGRGSRVWPTRTAMALITTEDEAAVEMRTSRRTRRQAAPWLEGWRSWLPSNGSRLSGDVGEGTPRTRVELEWQGEVVSGGV